MSEVKDKIKKILLEELNNIIDKVHNDNIQFIDDKMSYCKVSINGKDYLISYDKYIYIMTHDLPKFICDNRLIHISLNYDDYITRNLYNMYGKNIFECQSYRMIIIIEEDNKQYEISYISGRSKGIMINSKDKYFCNDSNISNYFMNNIYYCKSDVFIVNLSVKNKYLKKLRGAGSHRNIMIFHKNETNDSINFQIYIYEPHGTDIKKNRIPEHILNKFVEELNRNVLKFSDNRGITNNIKFTIIDKSDIICPRGIQSYTRKYDIGMCMLFSHFWYYMFFVCLMNKKFNKNYDIKSLITVLETDFIDTINKICKNTEGQQLLYKLMVRFSYYYMQEFFQNYYTPKQRKEIENKLSEYIIKNNIDNKNVIR